MPDKALDKWRNQGEREHQRDIKFKKVGTLVSAPIGEKQKMVKSVLWFLGGQFAWDMMDWSVLRKHNNQQMGITWAP